MASERLSHVFAYPSLTNEMRLEIKKITVQRFFLGETLLSIVGIDYSTVSEPIKNIIEYFTYF